MNTEQRMPPPGWAAGIAPAPSSRAVRRAERRRRVFPPLRPWILLSCIIIGLGLGIALAGTGFRYEPLPPDLDSTQAVNPEGSRLQQRLQRLQPTGPFVVIDATYNRLYLRRGDDVLLDAVCSSGSGMILKEVDGARHWVFDTPRGRFQILNKMRDPIWKKPDWAFVEEGKPIPRNPEERFEAGVLGEYGLYFGDGFLIHGTLYERLLGRSVTHGCVRLGRDDLRRVYETVSIGTPIYIF